MLRSRGSLSYSLPKSFAASNMLRSLANRSFAPLRIQPTPLVATSSLPSDTLVEEERLPEYNFEHFFPVNPEDLLHNRYEVIAKLGWGRYSTVRLARDMIRSVLCPIPLGPTTYSQSPISPLALRLLSTSMSSS